MAGITAAAGVAAMAGDLVSGGVVDRYDRCSIMLACDLARGVILGLLPVLWRNGIGSLALPYFVACAIAFLNSTFSIAHMAYMPTLVGREQIGEANTRTETTLTVAFLVGPLLAGFSAHREGAALALALDSGTFFVSAGALAWVKYTTRRATPPVDVDPTSTPAATRSSLVAGVRYLFRERTLRWLLFVVGAQAVATGAVVDLLIFRIERELRLDARSVGLAIALAAGGAVIGSIFSSVLRRRMGLRACCLVLTLAMGVALAAAGLGGFVALAAGVFVFELGRATFGVLSLTIRQEITPSAVLGRVTGAVRMMLCVPLTLGAAVAAAAARTGTSPVLVGLAVFTVVTGVVGTLTVPEERQNASPTFK